MNLFDKWFQCHSKITKLFWCSANLSYNQKCFPTSKRLRTTDLDSTGLLLWIYRFSLTTLNLDISVSFDLAKI